MLNFSIKTHKKPLHQRFQMAKFLACCYSMPKIFDTSSLKLDCKKKKKKIILYSQTALFLISLSFLSLTSLFSLPLFIISACRRSLLIVVDLCLFVTDLSPICLLISVVDCGLRISVEVDCGPFSLLFLGWFRL